MAYISLPMTPPRVVKSNQTKKLSHAPCQMIFPEATVLEVKLADRFGLGTNPVQTFLGSMLDYSPHTVANYRRGLARFAEMVQVPLDLAPINDLREAIRVMKLKYKPTSLHSYMAALRMFLRFVGRHEDAEALPTFPCPWVPRDAPTSQEITKVLRYATLAERTLILTFYSTDARCCEILGDRSVGRPPALVKNINWQEGSIKILAKGGWVDTAIFWLRRKQAMNTLKEFLGGRQEGAIFPFGDSYARRLVRRAGARVGVKTGLHLLRHSDIRSLLKQNANPFHIAAHARHKNISTTMKYLSSMKLDIIRKSKEREWK